MPRHDMFSLGTGYDILFYKTELGCHNKEKS
jgi:hypothetical protein